MANSQQIFEALVAIRADTVAFKGDLARAETTLKGSLLSMQGIAKSLAPVFEIIGIEEFVRHMLNLGEQLTNISKQTGLSVEVLGGIKPVLDSSGSSVEAFAKGFSRLQRSLGDITGQGKLAGEALAAIGLNAAQISKESPDVALEKIVTALGKVEDPNIRASIATRLFSRAGADLIPVVLNLAEHGIPKLSDSTAEAYKRLGELKEQLIFLGAGLTNFVAGPLANFLLHIQGGLHIVGELANAITGLTNVFKVPALETADAVRSVDDFTKKVADSLGVTSKEIAQKTDAELNAIGAASDSASVKAIIPALLAARQKSFDLRTKDVTPALPKAGPPSDFGALPNVEANKAQDQARAFLEGIQKQADALRTQIASVSAGPTEAALVKLDEEFDRFKTKLKDEGLKLPAGLSASFDKARETVKGLSIELEKTKEIFARFAIDEKDVLDGLKDIDKIQLAPFKLQDEVEIQRLGEAADRAAKDFDDLAEATRAWADLGADSSRAADALTVSLKDIDAQAAVFGRTFDVTGAKISAIEGAIKDNIAAQLKLKGAVDLSDQSLVDLQNTLGGLKTQNTFGNIFESIGSDIAGALDGAFDTTKTWGDKMKSLLLNIAHSISKSFSDELGKEIAAGLKDLFSGGDSATGAGGGQSGGILGQLVGSLGGLIRGAFGAISGFFTTAAPEVASAAAGTATDLLGGLLQAAHTGGFVANDGSIRRFARGGMVNGAGEVPAVLHTGEFVLRKSVVDALGVGMLQKINAGGLVARFATGGIVGADMADWTMQRSNTSQLTTPAMAATIPTESRNQNRAQNIKIDIHGSIIPERPGMKKEDIVKVVVADYNAYGLMRTTIRGDR